jgi:hypothetical protein
MYIRVSGINNKPSNGYAYITRPRVPKTSNNDPKNYKGGGLE